jgi:7-cyano-7-deazaguanine synthase
MVAKKENSEIATVTFNYGQMALDKELKSAKKISKVLGAENQVFDISFVKEFSKSGLNTGNIPNPKKDDLDDFKESEKTMKSVWVPARNMIMFSIASGFAEGINAEKIYSGLNKEEGVTFPDNSTEFINSFNKSLEYGTLNKVKMYAPLYNLDKVEIATFGKRLEDELGLDILKYSYSCYRDNLKDYLHCGTCESCMRRKRAFESAGIVDPTNYILQ